ncbi:MAG TPA: arylamine N-acetyltransferase [Melioribacteraceae bacterium]|nr:arylamine N-acetyltransferase [Melioribacteraceae bacterium]
MNDLSVEKYLERIGLVKIEAPSIEFLSKLQLAHLYSIPFEDLDIPDRARIILDIKRFYYKIIPAKRGGFCYELNGLFHWLLTQLGFNVDMLSARVYNKQIQELGPEFDHMTLLVHLDKDYLVDVGFGDSFRIPIEMPSGECADISGRYKTFPAEGNLFELKKFEENDWMLQYTFKTIPRKLSDYSEMCDFQQDSPDSHFRTRMKCTIATPTGRITLSDNSLTITRHGEKKRTEIADNRQFFNFLYQYFEIEL